MTATQLASRIDAVKIYAAGATVTRIAELPASGGELPEIVEIAGLPLALDDSSLRVRVEAERENAPIAGDVRIGLAVPERQETPAPSLDSEVLAAAAEVRRIQDSIALIDNEISVLQQLQVPSRPAWEAWIAPPPSPMSARLALANFSDELLRARIQEKRETREQLRRAKEHLADLQQKQARASSARDARPEELRKSAAVSLSYQGDSPTAQPARLVVEYFVPGARWTPAYVCRLNSAESTATIAVRGLICQRTGEDWSGVRLELSTAEPVAWCELPQLRSLRLGRQQPVARKAGWRPPPVGAEILFEDFDRQQQKMFAATQQVSGKAEESYIKEAPLSSEDTSIPQKIIKKSESDAIKQITQKPTTNFSPKERRLLITLQGNFSPFGNKLIQAGYVDRNQMQQAQSESRKSGKPLLSILEEITGRELPPELQRQYKKQQLFELKVLYGIEAIDLELEQISAEQVAFLIETLISVDMCRRHRLLPLAKLETAPPFLLVAMVEPDNLTALDDLNRMLQPQKLGLLKRVITQEDYEQLLNQYLDAQVQQRVAVAAKTAELDLTFDPNALDDVDIGEAFADDDFDTDMDLNRALTEADSAPIVKTVNQILAQALTDAVSEIHIEPQEEFLSIRMRKDGVLKEYLRLPKKIVNPLVSRFKIMADLDVAQRRKAQDGRIRRIFQGRTVEFLVNCSPSRYGEKICIWLLDNLTLAAATTLEIDFPRDFLNYGLMRIGAASDPNKRGILSVEQRHEAYLEILLRQKVAVSYSVLEVVQKAVSDAQNCLLAALPVGGINVREAAGSFDYAYSADGRVDVPSDGEFHSVALTAKNTTVQMRYVVVPREDDSVFRIVQLRNPLSAPLLAGPADIYVDGDYILSANIATVPPKGQMELGLGVEQAIKVARNTSYEEVRSGETLVAFNEMHHKINIEIANNLSREADIEVRERVPMPQKGAKVDVQIESVSPAWEKYEQQERGAPIEGGYRWRLQVPAKDKTELCVHYIIKTFVDSEIVGGNRRED